MAKLHNKIQIYVVKFETKRNEKAKTNVQTKTKRNETKQMRKNRHSQNYRKPHPQSRMTTTTNKAISFCHSNWLLRFIPNCIRCVCVCVFSVFAKWHGFGTPTVFKTLMSFTIKPICTLFCHSVYPVIIYCVVFNGFSNRLLCTEIRWNRACLLRLHFLLMLLFKFCWYYK